MTTANIPRIGPHAGIFPLLMVVWPMLVFGAEVGAAPPGKSVVDAALGDLPLARCLAIAQSEKESESRRVAALERLGADNNAQWRQPLLALLDTRRDQPIAGGVGLAAVAALAKIAGADGPALLVDIGTNHRYPPDARNAALRALVTTTQGREAAFTLAREPKTPKGARVLLAYLLHCHPDAPTRARAEADVPLPVARTGKPVAIPTMLALPGNPRRGERIFFTDKSAACSRCHRVQGAGKWVGPDLSAVATRRDRFTLLHDLLDPSAKVDSEFLTHTLALTNGSVVTGLISAENERDIIFSIKQGERMVIPRDLVEQRAPIFQSAMPDNLLEFLEAQDVADLLAFLERQTQPVFPVREFWLLGPLSKDLYQHPWKPGAGTNPQLPVQLPSGQKLAWQQVLVGRDDYLDFSSRVKLMDGQELYCLVQARSNSAQPARFLIETTSKVTVWCQGQTIPLKARHRSGPSVIWEGSIPLAAGQTTDLLLRVESGYLHRGMVVTIAAQQPVTVGTP